jgi:hypothetical protein
MTLYSSDPRIGAIGGPQETAYPPFIVYARVVPVIASGRRREFVHDLEKKAQMIETALVKAGFNLAIPVAFTPNFRQSPSRVTIVGFDKVSTEAGGSFPLDPNVPPVTPTHSIIHSGTVEGEKTSVLKSVQGIQTYGDNPTAANQLSVKALKSAIEAAVATITPTPPSFKIFYIDYNGVKYGQLPPKKGFFSFPT